MLPLHVSILSIDKGDVINWNVSSTCVYMQWYSNVTRIKIRLKKSMSHFSY